MVTRAVRLGVAALLGSALVSSSASALVVYDKPAGNDSQPVLDRGWSFTGSWKAGGGVAVAPNYFLTAKHLLGTVGDTFTLNGTPYTAIDTVDIQFGGTIASDLELVKVAVDNDPMTATPDPMAYADLYRGSDEDTKPFTAVGFGTHAQGAAVTTGMTNNGWQWATPGKNWAANNFATPDVSGGIRYLPFSFSSVNGVDEGIYTVGDSGGGAFINVGGQYKLAGVGLSVDPFYTNATDPDTAWLQAAIYNTSGLFEDSVMGPDTAKTPASGSTQWGYASRVSSYADQIDLITGLPEPSSIAALVLLGGMGLRRRAR